MAATPEWGCCYAEHILRDSECVDQLGAVFDLLPLPPANLSERGDGQRRGPEAEATRMVPAALRPRIAWRAPRRSGRTLCSG